MHIVIIMGVWAAQKFDSIGSFFLIAIKTVFDMLAHVTIDLGFDKTGRAQTVR